MTQSQGSFIWYELLTTDPDGAREFYGKVIGWKIAGTPDPLAGGMDYRLITRSGGGNSGGVLGLTRAMLGSGARPCWMGYLHVEDVDAALEAIQSEGGKIFMPATDLPVGRIAMVTDPQGVPFYLMKPVPPAGSAPQESDVFSPTEAEHVRWNELSTTDPDAAIAFYSRHFGWDQQGEMDMGEMGSYRFIQKDGMGIGAIMPKMPAMPVPFWSFYIGVDDIDRAAAAITAGGGKVVNGPMEIPGGEFALNAMDPQGAAFGLVGPHKG